MKNLETLLQKTDTDERCGLILKDGTVLELDNVAEDKEKAFEISASDVIEYEDTMTGTWHTHPYEPSNLSERDYIGFLMWPNLKHYIIGTDGVSEYYVKDGIIYNAD